MTTAAVPALDRLRKGAGVMAACWRRGDRCPAGWSLSEECSCAKPTMFCKAREQWILILLESGEASRRGGDCGPFSMIEIMTSQEVEATGFTITPDAGPKIGPKGTLLMQAASKVASGAGDSASSLLRLLEKFPGAKITEVQQPA